MARANKDQHKAAIGKQLPNKKLVELTEADAASSSRPADATSAPLETMRQKYFGASVPPAAREYAAFISDEDVKAGNAAAVEGGDVTIERFVSADSETNNQRGPGPKDEVFRGSEHIGSQG